MSTSNSRTDALTDARNAMTARAVPKGSNYMHLPIQESFDWPEIIRHAKSVHTPENGKYYLVVFRSNLRSTTDRSLVAKLDAAAHEEAKSSSSLMYYFAGIPMGQSAMSWCLWTDMGEARRALGGTAHRQAASQAGSLYESFKIELYDVYEEAGQIRFDPVSKVRA